MQKFHRPLSIHFIRTELKQYLPKTIKVSNSLLDYSLLDYIRRHINEISM